ncbi:ArgP/LysG family DNA-binding transcriptional regulator [Brevibacterium sp. 5221]|uniref:ArgP/LysG family DNA-binding transcriptional regulator n=1 Tax=Brevibacterium rongguiense TaxID=2695267 RepID=A0A6N9H4C0_9MICO|nr:ArgP/LysG family DNA-binding transcriptional regulator [Brevibacterium rongguiense]MYM18606.1 ArgP/LysG family DNA-binding transcriptional regulator [Brevibacterium rongguiense]
MPDLSGLSAAQLHTFATVVEEGTIEAAAAELGVTGSAVSQRLKALEAHVGAVLLQRTKPVALTEVGEIVHRLALQYAIAAHDAEAALDARTHVRGFTRVAIVVNADAMATWILPALEEVARSRRLLLDIVREDEQQAADYLQRGIAMAAVSSAPAGAPGTTAQHLGTWRYWPLAHPRFSAAHFPRGLTARAVGRAPVLRYDPRDTIPLDFLARELGEPADPPAHFIPEARQLVLGAARQLGWTLATAPFRRLVPGSSVLRPIPGTEPYDVDLYWHQWTMHSPTLDALAGAVHAAAADSELQRDW